MTSTFTRKSYPRDTGKSSVVDDSKKKTSLLQDNSWIKKEPIDDKVVDQTTNYGRSVLGRYKSNENLTSPSETKTSTVFTSSSTVTDSGSPRTSVQSLTKRFSTSQDELDSFSTPTTPTPSYKDGTKTTVTTSRTSVLNSPTKTKTFSEKIFTNSKTTTSEEIKTIKPVRTPTSPTKTTKQETFTVTTSKDSPVQDGTKTVKSVTIPSSPDKNTKTETVTVTTFQDTIVKDDIKSVKSTPPSSQTKTISDTTYTSTTPTSKPSSYSFSSKSSTEDHLFDTLIPSSIKDTYASDIRNDKSSETRSTAYTRMSSKDSRPEEYISENVYTEYVKTSSAMSDSHVLDSRRGTTKTYTATTYSDSRPEILLDTYKSSRSSMEMLYTTPERKIYAEKDICTYCQKPILYDTKMILPEMDIKCHANCFKCQVCNSNLGHLKAGDSMWVYRRNVHCEACFGVIKGKWHR
ncbi:sciellin [Tachysurus ichikawai]